MLHVVYTQAHEGKRGIHLNFLTSSGKFFSYQVPLETVSMKPCFHTHKMTIQDYDDICAWVNATYEGFDPRWKELRSDYDLENIH